MQGHHPNITRQRGAGVSRLLIILQLFVRCINLTGCATIITVLEPDRQDLRLNACSGYEACRIFDSASNQRHNNTTSAMFMLQPGNARQHPRRR